MAGLAGLVSIAVWVVCAAPAAAGSFHWSAPKLIDRATVPARAYDAVPTIHALACPSLELCVGAGSDGSIVTSTAPASPGSWRTALVHRGGAILDVSCPSTSLCLAAVDDAVLASTDPAGGASAWHEITTPLNKGLGVSCPTASLCVLIGNTNMIATSTNPANVTPTWSVRTLSQRVLGRLESVSCSSASFCVASDGLRTFASTDPTGGTSSWSDAASPHDTSPPVACNSLVSCRVTQNDSVHRAAVANRHRDMTAMSCTSSGFCVAGDLYGNLWARADPAHAWTRTVGVSSSGFESIACPSPSLCLAADFEGRIATSAAPASEHPSWSLTPPLIGHGPTRPATLIGISCGSSRLCAAIDSAGNVLTTTRPAGPASGWQSIPIDPGLRFRDVSCTRTRFCIAVADKSYLATSTRPTGAAARWKLTGLDLFDDTSDGVDPHDALTDVSCASASLCVATRWTGGENNLEVSLNPAAPAPIWRGRGLGQFKYDFFHAISCPSRVLCIAADAVGGNIVTSIDAGRHWRFTKIEPRGAWNKRTTDIPSVNAVSCPTASFCIAVDDIGQIITTHNATGGYRAWHRSQLPHGHELTAVSCGSVSLCAGIDQHGNVLVSTQANVPGSTWNVAHIHQRATHLSCPTARMCVATTSGGNVSVGRR
jgi:hypothetical protein